MVAGENESENEAGEGLLVAGWGEAGGEKGSEESTKTWKLI